MNEILEEIKKAAAGRSVPPAKKNIDTTRLVCYRCFALQKRKTNG